MFCRNDIRGLEIKTKPSCSEGDKKKEPAVSVVSLFTFNFIFVSSRLVPTVEYTFNKVTSTNVDVRHCCAEDEVGPRWVNNN